jgi:hypothetical protein
MSGIITVAELRPGMKVAIIEDPDSSAAARIIGDATDGLIESERARRYEGIVLEVVAVDKPIALFRCFAAPAQKICLSGDKLAFKELSAPFVESLRKALDEPNQAAAGAGDAAARMIEAMSQVVNANFADVNRRLIALERPPAPRRPWWRIFR